MAYQSIGRGTSANDGTGDDLRTGAGKVNANFVEVYTYLGDGSTLSSDPVVTEAATQTLTNKTITGTFTGNITGDVTGDVSGEAGTVAALTGLDTDDLSEGSTNLYYTDARADARISAAGIPADTDDLSEGATNLYYTDARADARIAAAGIPSDTDGLSEGSTNLYYTDARADARIAAASTTDLSDADQTVATTDDVDFNTVTLANALQLAVYADTTARDAAIASPAAGMVVFVTDGDGGGTAQFQGYDGSAWVALN
jgi:hypothetical protein